MGRRIIIWGKVWQHTENDDHTQSFMKQLCNMAARSAHKQADALHIYAAQMSFVRRLLGLAILESQR